MRPLAGIDLVDGVIRVAEDDERVIGRAVESGGATIARNTIVRKASPKVALGGTRILTCPGARNAASAAILDGRRL